MAFLVFATAGLHRCALLEKLQPFGKRTLPHLVFPMHSRHSFWSAPCTHHLLGSWNSKTSPASAGVFSGSMAKLQTLRQRAFIAQNGCCFYCNLPMWERANQPAFARQYRLSSKLLALCQSTAEHLHARQDGGQDAEHNIAAACRFCNATRHKGRTDNAPSPQQYKAQIQRRIAQGKWHPALALLQQGTVRESVASRHHQRMAAIKPAKPAAAMPNAASTLATAIRRA